VKPEHLIEYQGRKPFRPFTINLNDGEAIPIVDAYDLLLHPRKPDLVIAFTEDGAMHLFEYSVISSLSEASAT
jgi:hypothetical protein